MNCLCSSAVENMYHGYCHATMPEKDKNILKNNQDKNPFKNSFVIYANTETRMGKIHTCDNNQEESSTS